METTGMGSPLKDVANGVSATGAVSLSRAHQADGATNSGGAVM
jgi:hypothetical protein